MWPIDGCDFCITYIPSARDTPEHEGYNLCNTIIALVTHLHLHSDASTRLATLTSLDRFVVIACVSKPVFTDFVHLFC